MMCIIRFFVFCCQHTSCCYPGENTGRL